MASEQDGSAGSGRPPGGRRRRPAPTIDLEATDVTSTPEPEAKPEPQAAAPDAASEPRTESSQQARPTWPLIGAPGPLIAGGAAGAAAAALVFLLLWLSGAFAPRDDGAAALTGKIAALETQVRELAARRAPTVDPKAIADLSARLDVIDAGLRRVDERLARAESTLATPRSAPTDPAVLERLGAAESMGRALTATISDLRQRIDDLATTARDAKSRADAAADKADKATTPRPEAIQRSDLDALAARLAALEQAEKAIDRRVEQAATGASADRAVRLAVVAAALRSAVERSMPFTAELAAAKALAPDAAALAPLEPFATSGVPSPQTLARDLHQLAPALASAAGTPAHDGGMLDRLQANAERLVRVRPVGETPGDDASSVVARAEAKADRGDIAGAFADLDRLPPAAKTIAAGWIKAAQGRVAAVEAARKLAADSLAALGKSAP
jgi:hypothetical protein